MGLLQRLQAAGKALIAPATRADIGYLSDRGWVQTNGRNVSEVEYQGRQVRLAWERHPVVQACVRLIVDHLAAVPFEVYRETPDGPEPVEPTHPLQSLLDNPHPAIPASRHRALSGMHVLFYGNALWHEVRGEATAIRRFGLPDRLDLIHPERLRFAWYDEDLDMIAKWDWSSENTGTLRSALATDIVHFADYAGDNWALGYPRGAAALLDIATDQEASRYVREVLNNDGSPTLVFLLHELASQEVADKAEAVWQEKRAKRGQRGRAAFMSGTAKVEQLGFSLSDLEFPDLRRVSREDICAVFGVDPHLIGGVATTKDSALSGGEQYREARRRLIAQAVTPLMILMESQINQWLAPEFGEVKVRFSPEALTELTENELETSTKALAEFAGKVRTWEETREVIGLPGEADPAQHLLAADGLRTVALTLEMAAEKPPDPLTLISAQAEADKESGAPPAGNASTEAAGQATQRGAAPLPVTRTGLTPEQRVAHWQDFDTRAKSDEAAYLRAALAQFATERALVGRVIAGTTRQDPGPALTAAEVEQLIAAINELFRPQGDAHAGWVERFTPLETATGAKAAERVTLQLGVNLPVGVSPAFRAAMEARVTRLAGFTTQETARQITDAILTGRAQGMGVQGIAELISDTAFGGLERTRAEVIARTETVGAINEAEWRAARESTLARSKEWLTQGDDRVRDSHAMLDGVRIGMDDVFANGLTHPHMVGADAGEVVNCRCAAFYSADAPET